MTKDDGSYFEALQRDSGFVFFIRVDYICRVAVTRAAVVLSSSCSPSLLLTRLSGDPTRDKKYP